MSKDLDLSKFKCLQCGNCCKPEGYVRLAKGEAEKIAAYLGIPLPEFLEKHTRITEDRLHLSLMEKEDGGCVYLDENNSCILQDVKPLQCSEFPFHWNYEGWEDICKGAQLLRKNTTKGSDDT